MISLMLSVYGITLGILYRFKIIPLPILTFNNLPTFVLKQYFSYIFFLSNDVASGSEITPCNKIGKPLVVYRFSGNVVTSITTLCT